MSRESAYQPLRQQEMSNIHTLSDYRDEERPPARPMDVPQAWRNGGQQTHMPGNSGQQQQQVMQPDDMFWSYNVEGPMQLHHILIGSCCPCFVGNPCSKARKQDYLRMLLTFIFWITIVQVIMFVVELIVGGFAPLGQNPTLGPPTQTLELLGGKVSRYIKNYGHIHRWILPIFLHANILHLFFNMYVQIMVGLGYERNWNILRMVTIYFVSGIGGNLLSTNLLPQSISVGASGAILGMIGAKVANIVCRWGKMEAQMKVYHGISIFIILMFLFMTSFMPSVDWSSHLGGLICGMLTGFILFANEWNNRIIGIVSGIIAAILLFAFYLINILMTFLVLSV